MDVDEFELWEAEDAEEFSSSVAGDIGFIIDQALDARREAIIALPAEDFLLDAYARLAEGKRDWRHVMIVPTHDGIVAIDDPTSNVATLARIFMPKGARVLPLSAANDDYKRAAADADARLQALNWPFDLVVLTMDDDGGVIGLKQGPDIDEALTAADDRRCLGMLDDRGAEAISLSKRTITNARTLLLALSSPLQKAEAENAVEGDDGILARILADVAVPVDAHVVAAE
jgi:6-phosphogluconolactonase|tara:strand:- start:32334 stop:33023 length:690 start_codon:yes stop_codon:yes gene_type:complete